jgi:hypothetical protein
MREWKLLEIADLIRSTFHVINVLNLVHQPFNETQHVLTLLGKEIDKRVAQGKTLL